MIKQQTYHNGITVTHAGTDFKINLQHPLGYQPNGLYLHITIKQHNNNGYINSKSRTKNSNW